MPARVIRVVSDTPRVASGALALQFACCTSVVGRVHRGSLLFDASDTHARQAKRLPYKKRMSCLRCRAGASPAQLWSNTTRADSAVEEADAWATQERQRRIDEWSRWESHHLDGQVERRRVSGSERVNRLLPTALLE